MPQVLALRVVKVVQQVFMKSLIWIHSVVESAPFPEPTVRHVPAEEFSAIGCTVGDAAFLHLAGVLPAFYVA